MDDVHGTDDTLYYIYRCRRGRGLRYCLSSNEGQCESLNKWDKQGQDSRAFSLCSNETRRQNLGIWESAEKEKKDGPNMSDIHFGNMILRELRKQRYSVSWVAKEMGSDRSNMYKLLARPHLNTDFVLRASRLLRHDFFGEASTQLLDKSSACGENSNILW